MHRLGLLSLYQGKAARAVLGDRNTAWRYRLEALHDAVATGDRKICHAVLVGLAQDLVGAGRREAAWVVLDEMLANAHALSRA